MANADLERAQHARSPSTTGESEAARVEPLPSPLMRRKVMRRLAQRRAAASGVADGAAAAVDRAASSSGEPLPSNLQQSFGQSLGTDLSSVRVHTGAASAEASEAVSARAYTVGSDIHFAQGAYAPSSSDGQHLIAHEVAHTVQQAGSGGGAIQHKLDDASLEVSSPGDAAEHEADRAADSMVAGAPAQVGPASGVSRQAIARDKDPAKDKDKDAELPLKDLLAKGEGMTALEAARARDLLFALDGEEFRAAYKSAMSSGAFTGMVKKLGVPEMLKSMAKTTQQVVVPTTLLKPAANTIKDDFKRANEIYNLHGIEIVQGNQVVLSEKATKEILGEDMKLAENFEGGKATAEELKLVEQNRTAGRITGYWVPGFFDASAPTNPSSGEALRNSSLKNIGKDKTSVVVNTANKRQDTFAHELGHTLGLPHNSCDENNLMADGSSRNVGGGKGTDLLSKEELEVIKKSVYIELGKKAGSK